jgi:hypothetical protein
MIKLIKSWIHKFIYRKKVDRAIKDCMIKNERVLELMKDNQSD